ncbi:hypothetical protein FEM54_10375 [Pseudomonas edaphica]|uniref:Uncharacterized protein n=1 Tax=Pseudomonas edaphica TaxID=2006980 RepID=A0ABY2U8S2_9PSED|nr:hypothetical protein [Pseudomonas edaphica]TLG92047.1 hypothetical protein FEM54_10375 [Pseudomonas edaphica]
MGVDVPNLESACDHATPDKYSAVRLHMDLSFPHRELSQVNNWLEQRAWKDLELFLIERYPQHKQVITLWLEGSQARAQASEPAPTLRAVNT